MFTPQEVSEKTFPKTSALTAGYNMAAVDEFLDPLTEDYTALYKENAALKAKLKVLAEKIEEYRSTEDAMRTTLVTAQKLATKLVQEAHNYSENCRCPHNSEQNPTGHTIEVVKSNRCVCSRNQQKNCVVIHYSEKCFYLFICERMIQS